VTINRVRLMVIPTEVGIQAIPAEVGIQAIPEVGIQVIPTEVGIQAIPTEVGIQRSQAVAAEERGGALARKRLCDHRKYFFSAAFIATTRCRSKMSSTAAICLSIW
jgi:hypothetical protein